MGNLTKANVAFDNISSMRGVMVSQLFAGSALAIGDACRIASTGLVEKAVSTEVESFTFDGVTFVIEDFVGLCGKVVAAGQPVTLFSKGCIFAYATGLTPGAYYYISATAGLLSTSAIVASMAPVAMAISTTDILILR